MNFFIDTHAHLYAKEFDDDRQEVLARAEENSVAQIYLPNIDHTSIDEMLELESRHPDRCFAMMGLHPCSVTKKFEQELYRVEDWLGKRKFIAIGEIGTDLYWDKQFWNEQKEAFVQQVRWAIQYDVPIAIHSRDSLDETIALLEPLQHEKLRGVFHCYTGNVQQAKQITAMNFYLGIGGVISFKNSNLDKVIAEVDISRLLLETDSPYLAPIPHRGKRNEPAYLTLIAEKVAQCKNISVEEVRASTTHNALQLFAHAVKNS